MSEWQQPNHLFQRDVDEVDAIINHAILEEASDIHFEPFENNYRIRHRQDGILQLLANKPTNIAQKIIIRLKIMAELDIAEKRLPQDGRFNFTAANASTWDIRVSTCPMFYGEKMVLRLLNLKTSHFDLGALGLSVVQQDIFSEALSHPQGLILITGPTGSGKTMTLYTALDIINTLEKNTATIEDPIEILMPGINQINIHPQIGLTFSHALRALLRQDPDVIMVGEIRDEETAQMAIKAAQTGHLVLATLHTSSAVEAIHRLQNLGIKPHDVANTTKLIIAQRLVRRLQGRGRVGLFELLPISPAIKQSILEQQTLENILKIALKQGMMTMKKSGLMHVQAGLTSMDEIQRLKLAAS